MSLLKVSYVDVVGLLTGRGNREATVRVLTDPKTCDMRSARIIAIEL